ncbi:hypothetical protein PBI_MALAGASYROSE_14 [Mycobacterium phage MalagasyRose]|uniref:Uncharacterized protein n=1 Tax=Mycobacterium phage MalagasyRose TaxID=2599870 RepID=A0A5J6TEV1_9CAUD|nr:hypothetical protein QEH39_gp74 [Mycobacterium phage MalagasyRose]QFG08864.1 hypothetical protein PBI_MALAGASYROSE_14 [Mycobacterium phage MalagasyRose]
MPQRQVNVTLATYRDESGAHRFGLRGQVVDVHPDYVERFDRLNVVGGVEPVAVEVVTVNSDATPLEGLAEYLAAERAWGELVEVWLAAEDAAKQAAEPAPEGDGALSDNAAAEVLNLKPRRAQAS